MLSLISSVSQLFFTCVIGIYFFTKLRSESSDISNHKIENTREAEHLNRMRKISLTKPLTEKTRPSSFDEIIGQANGIRALKASLYGENPQHIIIYGPPGVGKTAAARLALEGAKLSPQTPFGKDAKFVEVDATTVRFDERSIADPLIGSVHDPIYQGAGDFGNLGIPVPKEGAVSKAHGGVLFLDEIGELHPVQINRLLKVLEDRRVCFESAYYSTSNKKIPTYIHDIFKNGLPADFRLIGATTRQPHEIPEAIRSRCVEIFFSPLNRQDIEKILINALTSLDVKADFSALQLISFYASNGRDAIKILQTAANIVLLENRNVITLADAQWTLNAGHYSATPDNILPVAN